MNEDELAAFLEGEPSPDAWPPPTGGQAGGETAAYLRDLLSDEATWIDPVPGGADALLAAIETESFLSAPPTPNGSAPPAPARRRRHLVLLPAAAALVLLAAVAAVVLLADRNGDDLPTQEFAMTGTELAEDASAQAVATDRPSGVAIELDISRLPEAEPGTYYQGWVRNDDTEEAVTIGTFHMRGDDDEPVELWSGVDLDDYATVTITLQQEGEGAESSGEVVLRGEVSP